MKLNVKKSILTLAAGVFIAASSFAQFTGTVEFTKKVGTIEVKYKYFVSGDNVRVEEINEGVVEGIQIMDLKTEMVYALSPERKMYMEVPNKRPATELNVEITKTGKTKEIKGIKCTEIVVTCTEKDRKVVYWVADGDYNFFSPMLKTLNRKENQAMFFLKIPAMEGKFPMLSTETVISTGAVVSELSTDKLTKEKVDANQFVIPSTYSKFER